MSLELRAIDFGSQLERTKLSLYWTSPAKLLAQIARPIFETPITKHLATNHSRLYTHYNRRTPSCRPLRWYSASARRRPVRAAPSDDPFGFLQINNQEPILTQPPATAVAHCKKGKGLVKINGKPLSLVQPEILRFKVQTPPDSLLIHKLTLNLGLQTPPNSRSRQILWRRHPRTSHRWRPHITGLRMQTGHRKVNRGILPEICG